MDDDTSGFPPTDRSLPIALIRAREHVMAPIRAMLAKTGLTEQQWRILRMLDEFGAMDSARLAERASLLAPSVTRIVQGMQARGLLTQSAHSTDRRKRTLNITPAGQRILSENKDEAARIAAAHRARLGPERHAQLLDLLEALGPDPK